MKKAIFLICSFLFIVQGLVFSQAQWGDVVHCVGDTTILTTTKNKVPFTPYYDYSWSRTLYLASEMTSGTIEHIAWKCGNVDDNDSTVTNVSIYFKATQATAVPDIDGDNIYIDPSTDGATLVFNGTITLTTYGWVDVTLTTPFELPEGYGLVVYVDNKDGSYTLMPIGIVIR